jgi:hypothetical protein
LIPAPEIARCYGSEATPKAIMRAYERYIVPDVKAIRSMLDAGGDAKDVVLSRDNAKGNGTLFSH